MKKKSNHHLVVVTLGPKFYWGPTRCQSANFRPPGNSPLYGGKNVRDMSPNMSIISGVGSMVVYPCHRIHGTDTSLPTKVSIKHIEINHPYISQRTDELFQQTTKHSGTEVIYELHLTSFSVEILVYLSETFGKHKKHHHGSDWKTQVASSIWPPIRKVNNLLKVRLGVHVDHLPLMESLHFASLANPGG